MKTEKSATTSLVPGEPAVHAGLAGITAGAPERASFASDSPEAMPQAAAPIDAGTTSESMAESVTRHALNPTLFEFRHLLSGIDSLDLGLHVEWGENWPEIACYFQDKKEEAFGSNGASDKTPAGRDFIHLPSGKAPNYRYHLQFPEYHAFIGIQEKPSLKSPSPNVYVSLSSETLWRFGILPSLALVSDDLRSFGGSILKVVPSRLDLAVDYLIPGGLSLAFIQDHQVSRSRAVAPYMNGDELETYYVGSPAAPIRLRIYNKSKEVRKKGVKLWFFPLWQVEENAEVWRIEFQLRRTVLKQFSINAETDLSEKAGGLWIYLTRGWFSLRLRDDPKPERRTIHPWWEDVQNQAEGLGPSIELQRNFTGSTPASIEWLLAHISGCITSVAARLGIWDREMVFDHLREEIPKQCPTHVFDREFLKRSINLGKNPGRVGAVYEDDEIPF